MSTVPTKGRRRWWLIVAAAAAIGVVALAASFCVGPPSYYGAKYGEAPVATRPTSTRRPLVPVRQTETHTCGYCALASIYTAYGLDPAVMRLRFRLGTDMPVTRLDDSTHGTIPPDIARVLRQDGFEFEPVDVSTANGADAAKRHLEAGHVALALVRVAQWHWLVLAGLDDSTVTICDSLRNELYTEPIDDYLQGRVERLYLIQPKTR